jgi:hypothetical protein
MSRIEGVIFSAMVAFMAVVLWVSVVRINDLEAQVVIMQNSIDQVVQFNFENCCD